MKSSILLLVFSAAVLGGCSSAYKTGQTPDDVYYSPQRPQDEYVNVKENDDSRYYGNDEYYDDQYLHMKVHNRLVWSELDDYYYNPSYSYGYYNSWNWNNPWSPFTYWNYFYNPYCSPVIIGSKSNSVYNHPRIFNLNSYNNNQLSNNNINSKGGAYNDGYNNNNYNKPVRIIGVNNSKSNINTNTGNFLRNIFNGSSNNNNSNNSSSSNPGRNSGSNNSSGSSGSSGGSHSAPVRRF
ncbi:MAG: hypothetical protein ACHQF0_14260 [Chitinophagales bacterium]